MNSTQAPKNNEAIVNTSGRRSGEAFLSLISDFRVCDKGTLVQHEKTATFLDILKSFFRPTLVRV